MPFLQYQGKLEHEASRGPLVSRDLLDRKAREENPVKPDILDLLGLRDRRELPDRSEDQGKKDPLAPLGRKDH